MAEQAGTGDPRKTREDREDVVPEISLIPDG
jgi:hypothetical protein